MEPLVFTPFLRPMPWGGRRLGGFLGKALPPDGLWGESWEVSRHPLHVSVVGEGPLAGTPITHLPDPHLRDFPLLVKYLDAHDWLSLQVHPEDGVAQMLAGEPTGKTEAWIVLDVEPHACIYAGLLPGVDRSRLEEALRRGHLLDCLHQLHPSKGDCLFFPAGTVHAVGGGVLLAEVQQSSDATLRLYDWGRVGLDGKPRQLHLEQAMEAINWTMGPVTPIVPQQLPGLPGEHLVTSRYFLLDRFHIDADFLSPYPDRFSLWMVLDGTADLTTSSGYCRFFRRGDTVVIPAIVPELTWHPRENCTLLGVTTP